MKDCWKEKNRVKGFSSRLTKVLFPTRIFRVNIALALFTFFILAFMVLVAMPGVNASSMRTGLVGEWAFDGGYGTTAYDTSGYGNDGSPVGWYTSDVTGSGTASANSYYLSPDPTYHPSNVFDDNTGTYWDGCCSGYPDQWLKYDFGAGEEKIINNLKEKFPEKYA